MFVLVILSQLMKGERYHVVLRKNTAFARNLINPLKTQI